MGIPTIARGLRDVVTEKVEISESVSELQTARDRALEAPCIPWNGALDVDRALLGCQTLRVFDSGSSNAQGATSAAGTM